MTKPYITKNRATLRDVALQAGVSASTVSAVLAGKRENRRISDETCAKVLSVAQELAYSPNLLHRSIRHGHTRILSLYNSFRVRKRDDLYMDRLLGAIEEASGHFGYNVLVHTDYKSSAEEVFKCLNGGFSDGVMLFGSHANEPLLEFLLDAGLPTVLIAPRNVSPSFPCVTEDVELGMRLVAEALVARGHRCIAAIADNGAGNIDTTGRVSLLRSELGLRGVELRDSHVIPYEGDPERATDQLLALEPRPTAVFVWHDGNAYRVLDSLEARGVVVPRDLSLVAYDGIRWPAKSPHVVASVQVPIDEIAQKGVRLLIDMISGKDVHAAVSTEPVRFCPGSTLGVPHSKEGI